MFYNHSTDNLVEVHLQFECKCEVPAVGANGLLVFHTAYPAGDSVIDFKVLVPSEVVKTKDALTDYLHSRQESSGSEFVSLDHANIWIADPDHEHGGQFAFS